MTSTGTKRVSRAILGLMMGGAGIAHFARSDLFTQLVPASLGRYRTQVNAAAGVVQVVSAVSFLVPSLRGLARGVPAPCSSRPSRKRSTRSVTPTG